MSKVRFIVLSVLAVLAVSAVASASASAHEFLVNGKPVTGTEPVTSTGGLFRLVAATKIIDCETANGFGLILSGGKTFIHDIHFLNCKTSQTKCAVHSIGASNGLILLVNVPDLLVTRKTSGGAEVTADEFQENPTTKEFITLKFLAEAGGSCSEFGTETKVKGQVAAQVNNGTESLEFTEPELQGNSLEAFGKAAKFFGTAKQKLVNGGVLTAD